MVSTSRDIYNQIKAICDGCDTILDAGIFCDEYCNRYPHLKHMIKSYIYNRKYPDKLDFKTKHSSLSDIWRSKHRDDAYILISKLTQVSQDDIFRKTLERIASTKDYKQRELKINSDEHYISKQCPHCRHTVCVSDTTEYIVCGYHDQTKGYDWMGCGRDWCFSCEKLLCKKWETNLLMIKENTIHNNECCAKHAKNNNKQYHLDYCHCINAHNMPFMIDK